MESLAETMMEATTGSIAETTTGAMVRSNV